MKKKLLMILLTAMLAGATCACSSSVSKDAAKGSGSNETVFKIDGEACSVSMARVYLLNYQNIYGKMYQVDVTSQEDKATSFETYIKDMTLSQLAQTTAMAKLAKEKDLSIDEQMQSNIEKAAKEYYDSLNAAEKDYTKISESDLAEMYEDYALANQLYSFLTKEVSEEVSDNEARVMEIQQIVVSDAKKAKQVKKKLKSGSDFESVAASYNEKDQINLKVRRGDLPEKVEEAAYDLDDDEIAYDIETDQGYYFIYCVDHYLKEETKENKQLIAKERKTKTFESEYHTYLDQVSTKLNQDTWEEISLVTGEDYTSNSFFTTYDKYCK